MAAYNAMIWLWSALVGLGGSVIGGVVGGLFVLIAGERQWKRDRADARIERSHQAAMSIADAIARLEEQVVAWQANQQDTVSLTAEFNATARNIVVQSMALIDPAVRVRVQIHAQLAGRLVAVAQSSVGSPFPASMMIPERRHADAVIAALEAHVQDQVLPAYRPPPLTDAIALLSYQPSPEYQADT
jgi:hypothetical protein